MENYGGKILANFAWGINQRWVAEWDSLSKSVNDFRIDWILLGKLF